MNAEVGELCKCQTASFSCSSCSEKYSLCLLILTGKKNSTSCWTYAFLACSHSSMPQLSFTICCWLPFLPFIMDESPTELSPQPHQPLSPYPPVSLFHCLQFGCNRNSFFTIKTPVGTCVLFFRGENFHHISKGVRDPKRVKNRCFRAFVGSCLSFP